MCEQKNKKNFKFMRNFTLLENVWLKINFIKNNLVFFFLNGAQTSALLKLMYKKLLPYNNVNSM